MKTHAVRNIVIVGGGTAGWMCAAALSQHFLGEAVSIRLIESSELGTVGVGESTIPSIRRFYAKLGLTDTDVIRATRATCKLGIEFRNWRKLEHSFIHPFGLFGQPLNQVPFVQCYLAACQAGLTDSLQDYSLGVALARNNKFCLPDPNPKCMLTIFDWALHFDAALFAGLMRDYAEKKNVLRTDARIVSVQSHQAGIKDLLLDNGEVVSGDLFIDCSGFRGLLIEQGLQTGYESWQQWLLCDKAVAVQTEVQQEPVARTRATAHTAGWQWRIPLQHRQGNGYVYSSSLISDDEATATMLANTDGKALHSPRYFNFTPGRRKLAWNKNCVALGLASGFLEPLESTSIALIETSIDRLLQTFNTPAYSEAEVDRFNQVTKLEYERIRDFIILHYKTSQRTDAELWRHCAAMDIPAELADKIQAFRQHAAVPRLPWEIFGADSWLALYEGMGVIPEQIPAAALQLPQQALLKELSQMRSFIHNTVQKVPTHSDFLERFCGYQPAHKMKTQLPC
jgi:tryptophan halogenase